MESKAVLAVGDSHARTAAAQGVLSRLAQLSVRSVTEPIADDTTGKLLANMLAAIAQFDNDAKSDRTRAGMKAALNVVVGRFRRRSGT